MSSVHSRWYGPDEHDPTPALAEHLARTTYQELPQDAREYAARSVMDTLGIALAGSSAPAAQKLLGLVQGWGGRQEATVLVTGARVPAPEAALANAVMARARLMDDMEERVGDHPTVAPLNAALAAAEVAGGCDGKQLLAAVALASDLVIRMRYALRTDARACPWCTETFAPLSAAIAAGKVWGFDAPRFMDAMGIAGMQMSSTWLMHQEGATIFHLQHGLAARAGFLAAALAREGIGGPHSLVEREYGLVHAYGSPGYDRAVLLDGLGRRFRNVDVTLKRYPAAGFTCWAIDGVLDLMRRHGLSASDIAGATVYVNERAYLRACQPEEVKRRPPTVVHAQLSIPYTVAAAIVRGDFFLDEVSPESLGDPAILAMAGRVRCVVDPELDRLGSVVAPLVLELHLGTGKSHRVRVDYPRGHARNPLTWDELADKFRRCARYAARPLDPGRVEEAIAALRRLDAVDDVRHVLRLLSAGG